MTSQVDIDMVERIGRLGSLGFIKSEIRFLTAQGEVEAVKVLEAGLKERGY